VLVEIVVGPEILNTALHDNPQWAEDHLKLATLFVNAGDLSRAAVEFEKLSELAANPAAAGYAAACRLALGERSRGDSLVSAAATRMNVPRAEVASWVDSLVLSMPTVRTRE
jgi:predicted TPR repeat methyltransferase